MKMRTLPFLLLIGVLALMPLPSGAQTQGSPWGEPALGLSQGVQIKEWSVTDHELDMMKVAGLSTVRFPMPWYAVEKGRGRFVWRAFDSIIERLRARGMRAVIILGAGHPAYTGTARQGEDDSETYPPPTTPDSLAAFSRYVAQAVSRFGADDIIWELWNEPDSKMFWFPIVNVDEYVAVATTACQTIKQVAPQARVIGPAMAGMPGTWGEAPSTFLARVLDSPLSSCLDALSLHPYRDREVPPETVQAAYRKAKTFIAAHTPKGQSVLPLISSEWGFPTTEVTQADQAAFLLRTYLLNLMNGVPLSIWYEWYDSGVDPDDPESHFGLLTHAKKPKEAYRALQAFLPPLHGGVIQERLALGKDEDYLLRIRNAEGHSFIVYWTSQKNREVTLQIGLAPSGETRVITLTELPQWSDLEHEDQTFIHSVPER